MIGTVDCCIQAKYPNMPLDPMVAYKGSPSSIRVRNVPKRIGDWHITNVFFAVTYPDSSIRTVECVLVGGVWVGTVEGTNRSGTSLNGYAIFANGIDENGNTVTGYILGKGDVNILQDDGSVSPDPLRYYVKILSSFPVFPQEGDMFPTDDGYVIWQNGEAHSLGITFKQLSGYVNDAISCKAEISSVEALGEDIAEVSASLSDYYKKSETSSVSEIQNALDAKQPSGDYALTSQIPTNVSQLSNDAGYLTEHQSLSDYYTKSETSSNVELDAKFETKADLSTIPTKTSELSNDSGFITSAAINDKRDLVDITYPASIIGDDYNIVNWTLTIDGQQSLIDKTWNFDLFEIQQSNRLWEVRDLGTESYAIITTADGHSFRIEMMIAKYDWPDDYDVQVYGSFTLDNIVDGQISYINLAWEYRGGGDATHFTAPIIPTLRNTTFALKDYVDSRLSALEARIAALENN